LEAGGETPDIHLGVEGEGVFFDEEGRIEGLAQSMQCRSERLLGGRPVEVGPKEAEEVIAGEGMLVGGEVINDGPAFAARQGEGPSIG
jgi:hypothetical protein